jgi:hypothetical protein
VRYLEVRGFISAAVTKGNAMIDLPLVWQERFAAQRTELSLCFVDLFDQSGQPKPTLVWRNLLQD